MRKGRRQVQVVVSHFLRWLRTVVVVVRDLGVQVVAAAAAAAPWQCPPLRHRL